MKKVAFSAASTGVLVCLCTASLIAAGVKPAAATRLSSVTTEITSAGDGLYRYDFTLINNSTDGESITDWAIPLFSLNDIVTESITAPASKAWGYVLGELQSNELSLVQKSGNYADFYGNSRQTYRNWGYDAAQDNQLSNDPNKFGPRPTAFNTPPYILRWFTGYGYQGSNPFSAEPVAAGGRLTGFSFLSQYNGKDAPYQTGWRDGTVNFGDPFTPNSPARQNAQGATDVPTPALLPGLASLGIGGWLKRRKQAAATSEAV